MHPSQVAILMATYNGEKFLHKQIDSIIRQSYPHWHLYILDDGSTDKTWEILQNYQALYGAEKIKIFRQENQGPAKSFLKLVCNQDIQADYYAYADQDDIWDIDKIEQAVHILETLDKQKPNLYFSAARLIDEHDNFIGNMKFNSAKKTFASALAENIAPGNTMVFNTKLRNVLQAAGVVDIVVHDWWTFLVATGCGGAIYADKNARISYRQHANNLIGYKKLSLCKKLKIHIRIKNFLRYVLGGNVRNVNLKNYNALNKIYSELTPSAQKKIYYFEKILNGEFFSSTYYLYKSGIYKKSLTLLAYAQAEIFLRQSNGSR